MKLGKKFKSFAKFQQCFEEFVKKQKVPWVTGSSKTVACHNEQQPEKPLHPSLSYAYINYTCKHTGTPRTASKGIRPNQSSFKTGCKARLRVSAQQVTQDLKITVLHVEHNHEIREEDVVFYPENRKIEGAHLKCVEDMFAKEVKPSIMRDFIHSNSGKCLTSQDLVNLNAKMKREKKRERLKARKAAMAENGEEVPEEKLTKEEELDDLVNELEDLKKTDPNATIIVGGNENGVIQFAFWCTGQMREDFEKYPEILCIDNTYNTNKNKMPLTVFICVDGEGHRRVAGYCFVASEERDGLRDSVGCFCECYASSIPKISVAMVDKDPNQITIIKELMPHLHIKELDPDTYYPYSKRRRSSTSNRKLRSRHSTTKIRKEVLDDDTPLAYATESHSDDDECELYCQLLAKKLRRLHQHQRDIVMHEIDNIMFNVKINGNSTGKQRRYFSQRTQSPLNVDIVVSENSEHCEEEYLEYPIED